MAKAMGLMEDAAAELARKKAASAKVKGLRSEIQAAEAEAAQLTAQQQHLQRQLASLTERLQRLEAQARPPGSPCGPGERAGLAARGPAVAGRGTGATAD